jgi:hypothetical protein
VDWNEVERALQDNAGLPRLVGGREGGSSWHKLDSVF